MKVWYGMKLSSGEGEGVERVIKKVLSRVRSEGRV